MKVKHGLAPKQVHLLLVLSKRSRWLIAKLVGLLAVEDRSGVTWRGRRLLSRHSLSRSRTSGMEVSDETIAVHSVLNEGGSVVIQGAAADHTTGAK